MNKENINNIFSENLKRWLLIRKKTQAELYKRMGVSSSVVSDWCTGKKIPRISKIIEISEWLSIELTDLLEEGKREPTDMDKIIYRLKDDEKFFDLVKDIDSMSEDELFKVKDYVDLLKK